MLKQGKLANWIIPDNKPMQVDLIEIRNIKVLETIKALNLELK
jgi:predicted amidohydrolase YtcJ